MRTLLIDNYDSFTYNLVHQISAATGREPVVVTNDDPGWRIGRLAEFDAVVISPGPGTPERAADFGICREVVERCELPLLGVCLGHQGIAAWHGGTVGRAPEPRHGRTSPVLHAGTGLFAGIPSPFEVVRYHSLAVTKLSDDLEALAGTPDGVLMALRHRTRPLWGLQFHPESICTRYGDRLLRNFAALASTDPPVRNSVRLAPERPKTASPRPYGRTYDLLVERIPTGWDDEAAFDGLFRDGPHAYWLDSSRPARGREGGRFSIMGDAAGPLARVATADIWTGTVSVRSGEAERLITGDFLDWLDQDLRSLRMTLPAGIALPFDFALGWVGYLGYELKAQCGGRPAHRSAEPDAVMVFADRAVVLDHLTGETYLLALAERGRRDRAEGWLRETAARLAALAGRVPEPVEPLRTGRLRLRHDRERYLELIAIAQEEIAAGETYEVCLTNMAEAETDAGEPAEAAWRAYRLLRRAAPAPFGALLRFGAVSVLSTSPERFLRVTADGRAESRPIKGTRPRGATPGADEALRRELGTSREGPVGEPDDRRPGPQRPRAVRRAGLGRGRRAVPGRDVRHRPPAGQHGTGPAARGRVGGGLRTGGVPRRLDDRGAQGPHDADHRPARRRAAWGVLRRDRLLLADRRRRPQHRHPHRRHDPGPDPLRHRGRGRRAVRPGGRVRGDRGQGGPAARADRRRLPRPYAGRGPARGRLLSGGEVRPPGVISPQPCISPQTGP